MKFYRLESRKGTGIYRALNGEKQEFLLEKYGASSRHPMPGDDDKLTENAPHLFCFRGFWTGEASKYIFGFSSVEQFRSWFYEDEFLKSLRRSRIKLNLYETSDCFLGYTQMIARKETLEFIGECDILTGELKKVKEIPCAPEKTVVN